MLLFFAKSIQWKVADAKEDDQMIKINLQRFAEGDPDVNKPAEKTYSEQYVKDLRDECKEHRTARKAAEQAAEQWKKTAAKIIGAAEDKDITESDIAAYQADNTRKLASACAVFSASSFGRFADALAGFAPLPVAVVLISGMSAANASSASMSPCTFPSSDIVSFVRSISLSASLWLIPC